MNAVHAESKYVWIRKRKWWFCLHVFMLTELFNECLQFCFLYKILIDSSLFLLFIYLSDEKTIHRPTVQNLSDNYVWYCVCMCTHTISWSLHTKSNMRFSTPTWPEKCINVLFILFVLEFRVCFFCCCFFYLGCGYRMWKDIILPSLAVSQPQECLRV